MILELQLKLSSDYSAFTFVKEPSDAAGLLKEHGSGITTNALKMIINQTSEAPEPSKVGKGVVESDKFGSLIDKNKSASKGAAKKDRQTDRTFDAEADANLRQEGSADTTMDEGVVCCCGFW
jgi:hypothetical protein